MESYVWKRGATCCRIHHQPGIDSAWRTEYVGHDPLANQGMTALPVPQAKSLMSQDSDEINTKGDELSDTQQVLTESSPDP